MFSLNALLHAVDFSVKLMKQSRGKIAALFYNIVESFRVKKIATMLGSFFTFSSMYSTALLQFLFFEKERERKKKITFTSIKN